MPSLQTFVIGANGLFDRLPCRQVVVKQKEGTIAF
jgi:SAM-dependent MidA family methyltransferase